MAVGDEAEQAEGSAVDLGPHAYFSSSSKGLEKTSEEALLASGILGVLLMAGIIGKGATVARTRFVGNCLVCKASKAEPSVKTSGSLTSLLARPPELTGTVKFPSRDGASSLELTHQH